MREFVTFVFVLVAGSAALFLRNPDPILSPAMYTEDGVWSGFLYSVGPLGTYANARADYFVVGNIVLLHVAQMLNSLLAGDTIENLPTVIAAVSYGFYALVAAFLLHTLRPYLRLGWRLACWAFVVCLPMGGHMNEVLGRLSNAGYAFYVIGTFSLLFRLSQPPQRWSWTVLGLDALLLLSAFTNPLCALLLVGATLLAFARPELRRSLNTFVLMAFAGVSLIAFEMALTADRPLGDGPTFSTSSMIAVGLGRSILYPFVFPIYAALNDLWALLGAAILFAYLGVAWWVSQSKLAFGTLLTALGLVTAATALGRLELHQHLVGYAGSFPDRYFYAQNVLILVAFVWASQELIGHFGRFRLVPLAALGVVAATWLLGAEVLFDPYIPALTVRTGASFADQVRAAPSPDGNANAIRVPIYPDGWHADFPRKVRG